MTTLRKTPAVNQAQIERFLAHTTSLTTAQKENYTSDIVKFTVTVAEAETFVQERSLKCNWNCTKLWDRINDTGRKRKAAGNGETGTVKRGPPKKWDWTERWECDHAGSYRDRQSTSISPSKRRPNRLHTSKKVDCSAYFWIRKFIGKDEVEIEYAWAHQNHELGSVESLSGHALTLHAKAWIRQKVDEGLTWAQIRPLLNVDQEIIDHIESGTCTDIPDRLRILYMDVYNALRRRLKEIAQLDVDGHKSLQIWKERLEGKGYRVLYETVRGAAASEQTYIFVLVSPWQQTLLQKYAKLACLDSTHNTCFSASGKEEKAFLYTVILKNLNTGKGVPGAFMFTPSEAQYAIANFVQWLRSSLSFLCNQWMIDCSDAEAAALRTACGDDVKIFVCLWHVLKAVSEQAKKKLSIRWNCDRQTKATENQSLRAEAIRDFQSLVHCLTEDEFEERWDDIQEKYYDHRDWLGYLRGEWIPKRERWCMAWRQDCPHYRIETNNLVESWHCQLKTHYLGLMRRQRVDVLLHILTEKVEPDFRRADFLVNFGFERARLSKAEVANQRRANEIPSTELESRADHAEELTDKTPDIYIQSFTDTNTWYRVGITDIMDSSGTTRSVITSCECPEFEQHEVKCKHMFLAGRFTGLAVHHIGRYNTQKLTLTASIPPQTLTTNDEVRQIKTAQISRLNSEGNTITNLINSLGKMDLDAVSREQLQNAESQMISTRRILSDIVYMRKLHSTQ